MEILTATVFLGALYLILAVYRLEKTIKNMTEIKDHCEVCQCNEWLCGHNERE